MSDEKLKKHIEEDHKNGSYQSSDRSKSHFRQMASNTQNDSLRFKKSRNVYGNLLFFIFLISLDWQRESLTLSNRTLDYIFTSIFIIVGLPLIYLFARDLFTPAASLGQSKMIVHGRLKNFEIPYENISRVVIDKTIYLHFKDDTQTDSGTYIHLRKSDFSKFKDELLKRFSDIKVEDQRRISSS